jgi:hypothetical protein
MALSLPQKATPLADKWTHTLFSVLFFVYFWQSLIYLLVLQPYFLLQRLKKDIQIS